MLTTMTNFFLPTFSRTSFTPPKPPSLAKAMAGKPNHLTT